MKISIFVVSYNRENLIEACLSGLSFADEIILVDKSSTDQTRELAAKWVDRIVTVPWSPAPGETFAHALSLCRHDWVIALCDDECLNVQALDFIATELLAPRADIYYLPRQDHILGRFDERAYYWPQWHPQLYRKSAFEYSNTVHGAPHPLSNNRYQVPSDSGIAVVHLSHENATEWIEKTNRYTSQRDRIRTYEDPAGKLVKFAGQNGDLKEFAHSAIDAIVPSGHRDDYLVRVALLRAIYDMVDRVKQLEEDDKIDGRELFKQTCVEMMQQYNVYYEGKSCRRERQQHEAP